VVAPSSSDTQLDNVSQSDATWDEERLLQMTDESKYGRLVDRSVIDSLLMLLRSAFLYDYRKHASEGLACFLLIARKSPGSGHVCNMLLGNLELNMKSVSPHFQ